MTLHLCCNDPHNGSPTGRVTAIEVQTKDSSLELESRFWDWGPKLFHGDGFIRIGGKKVRITSYRTWAGNWCWDAVRANSEDVVSLLNWPKFRKWFDVTEGPERLFNMYREGKPFSLKKRDEVRR